MKQKIERGDVIHSGIMGVMAAGLFMLMCFTGPASSCPVQFDPVSNDHGDIVLCSHNEHDSTAYSEVREKPDPVRRDCPKPKPDPVRPDNPRPDVRPRPEPPCPEPTRTPDNKSGDNEKKSPPRIEKDTPGIEASRDNQNRGEHQKLDKTPEDTKRGERQPREKSRPEKEPKQNGVDRQKHNNSGEPKRESKPDSGLCILL